MSEDERQRWDERYATGGYVPRRLPSPFLEDALSILPRGRALDLACGTGRHALRLAEAGFEVRGIDVSEVAITRAREEAERRGLDVEWQVADLDHVDLEPAASMLVLSVRYVNRDLWPQMVRALEPGGWLLMEQHLTTHRDVRGPGAPFRVEPGELLTAFGDLRIVRYLESIEHGDDDGRPAALVRLLACNGDPGW